MSFQVSLDSKAIETAITTKTKELIAVQINRQLYDLFSVRQYADKSVCGPAAALINTTIDELFLSEKFQSKIQAMCELHLDKAVEDACKRRIEHLAGKAVFAYKGNTGEMSANPANGKAQN